MNVGTMKFYFLFFASLGWAAGTITHQLDAQQQLRTLVPERIWFQEFSMLVDSAGFDRSAEKLMQHPRSDLEIAPSYAIAISKDYFLYSTMSGENVRLLDRYQQFEQSPFWRDPAAMERLSRLEGKE